MDYYTFITAAVQDRWNLWNVRGLMILSLCMQLILSIAAPLRQKTSNRFVIILAWSSYLMADWSAVYVFGLISNSASSYSGNDHAHVPLDVMALWAGFLLVHLGGPDTITAFSLEDNALWLRHLAGLVAQLFVFLYIFMKTLPNNRLLVPTVLMFVAGLINYGERTRALYLASSENLKTKSIVNNLTKEQETFHQIASGLVSNILPDLQAYNESHKLIFKPEKTPQTSESELNVLQGSERGLNVLQGSERGLNVLQSIEIELNALYELLYTKAKAATSTWGILARGIIYYSTQVAFILFCLADKHGFRGVDLAITYALFVGVFVLHVANTVMLGSTASRDFEGMETVRLALFQGIFPVLLLVALGFVLAKLGQFSAIHNLLYRRWSEDMGSVNMLSQSFKQCGSSKLGFIWNKLVGQRPTPVETILEDRTQVGERHTPVGSICDDRTLVRERPTTVETICEDRTQVGDRHTPVETISEDITLFGERHTPVETICEDITMAVCKSTIPDRRNWERPPYTMWDSVYVDIKRKVADTFDAAIMRKLYEARGNRALEEINCCDLMTYIRNFEYENTILIWHVATEICFNIEGEEDNADHSDWKRKRKLSKRLSDYLMYLLVRQPKLMSEVVGISQIRYKDTCVELKLLGRRFGSPTMKAFCTSIVEEYANITESSIKGNNHVHSVLKDSCGLLQILLKTEFCASIVNITDSSIEGNNHVHSVLKDSCELVQLLLKRGKDKRWDAIHKVWLELLSYAAGHCRVDSHLQLLREGGEFLTFVWMLMALCGIRDQLPVK